MITIAICKGRTAKQAIKFLVQCGYEFKDDVQTTRKLIIESTDNKIQVILMKGQDIPIYVDAGVVDMGLVGKDTLCESDCDVYEILSLDIGKCKLAVAGYANFNFKSKKFLKIGTKYPTMTKAYFKALGIRHEIVELSGSVELAPLIGLSDVIVDIVETGRTLSENDLTVLEDICDISSKIIANKLHFKTKYAENEPIINSLTSTKL
ncbi:MAG: ATP phosphoribosyltransferase [Clostridiales bacterium]|nr:ATP phosphoribosyltransferase [Clostridiales bacterium]